MPRHGYRWAVGPRVEIGTESEKEAPKGHPLLLRRYRYHRRIKGKGFYTPVFNEAKKQHTHDASEGVSYLIQIGIDVSLLASLNDYIRSSKNARQNNFTSKATIIRYIIKHIIPNIKLPKKIIDDISVRRKAKKQNSVRISLNSNLKKNGTLTLYISMAMSGT